MCAAPTFLPIPPLLFPAALLALAASSHGARAQTPVGLFEADRAHLPLGGAGVLALPGEVDLFLQQIDPIPVTRVDERDAVVPSDGSAFVRLRFSPALTLVDPGAGVINLWRLLAEVDLLRDWWFVGDGREPLAADPRARSETGLVGQRLSQLHLTAAGSHLAVQLGLTRSRWGLGLVSNAGDDPAPHTADSPFGIAFQGDHVVRLGVSAHPLGRGLATPPLTVALAFDGVIDDDTARWQDGDRAYQLVAAVSGQTEALRLGFYAAHRFQAHAEGGDTNVTVLDLTGRVRLAHEEGLSVFLEAELATIRGRTSLTQSVMSDTSFDVDQLGALARMAIESGPFLGVLEVGAASADNHPFDDEQRAFAMDRDHRVGLLLFREVLMAGAAVTVDNIADPDYRGTPPRGSERLATSGAVRGAIYANPRASFRLAEGLHLYAGFLYAASDGEYVDAFWSGLVGGAPRGPNNGPPATELGWEVDLGIAWRFSTEPLTWRLRLEGAWCSPGEVFDDEQGRAAPDVGGVWLQAGMLW